MATNMILQSGKELKITQCQIWAVRRIFQDCPPEALQELCVAVATWGWVLLCMCKTHVVSSPGHYHLMAARNRSRVAHYVTALTVVASSMKSTNHSNSRFQKPQPSLCKQIGPTWIIWIAGTQDVASPCLHTLSPGVTVHRHLPTTDNAFEENMTMNGISLEEGESATNSLQLVVFR
jgi:hypothetical protein